MTVVTRFDYKNSAQTYTAPSTIAGDRVHLVLFGADGPSTGDGSGGTVEGDLLVVAGDVLTIKTGGVGGSPGAAGTGVGGAGGYNGGGQGGYAAASGSYLPGFGGSGMTDLVKNGGSRLAVAAGAGGAGRTGPGGTRGAGGSGGGTTGQAGGSASGTTNPATGGGGGTQSAGGAAGVNSGAASTNATAGSSGQGGAGANPSASGTFGWAGGGGGGGYFGGGGGGGVGTAGSASSAGGGGGSNYSAGLSAPGGVATGGAFPTTVQNLRGTYTIGGGITPQPGFAYVVHSNKFVPSNIILRNDVNEAYGATNGDIAADRELRIDFTLTSADQSVNGTTTQVYGLDNLTRLNYRWRVVGDVSWNVVTGAAFTDLTNGPGNVPSTGGVVRLTLPAGTFGGQIDQVVEFQLLAYNSGLYNNYDGSSNWPNGLAGDWTASTYIRPRNRPTTGAWTSSAMTASPAKFAFTTPDGSTQWAVRVMADSSGSPGAQIGGTAINNGALDTARSDVTSPTTAPVTGGTYHPQFRYATYQAVWSDWVDAGPVVANINPPPVPTLTAVGDPSQGAIVITISNGTGSYPATSNRIFRSKSIGKGAGEDLIAQNVAPNGTFVDRRAGSGWQYRYRVEAVNATTYISSD